MRRICLARVIILQQKKWQNLATLETKKPPETTLYPAADFIHRQGKLEKAERS
jgi:hypothetical protein